MISRRMFLGGAAAVVATSCYPTKSGSRTAPQGAGLSLPQLRAMAGLPEQRNRMLGYPVNMNLPPDGFRAWQEELHTVGLDGFPFNNVGDPFEESHWPFHCHALEAGLIGRFGDLYGFPADDRWGFLSNSGTDSNMHGLYMGRTNLEGRTGRIPKIYFTEEAHYSIQILADLLAMQWVRVPTREDGRMDTEALGELLQRHAEYPALVVATVGTTFKGAVDLVDEIRPKLAGREAWLHLDAALFGGYLPHTTLADQMAQREGASGAGRSRYDSLAVSCHKFFGFPSPAGIFISTRSGFEEYHREFSRVHDPEYLMQVPGTITCSRDAVKAAEFYYYSSPEAFERQRADAEQILDGARYLREELATQFPELRAVRANPMSNTVYFEKPSDDLVHRYILATMDLERDGVAVPHAHVVVMPHARRAVLDRFLEDLARDRSKRVG